MPVDVLQQAMKELHHRLEHWTGEARRLEVAWNEAEGDSGADQSTRRLLEARMETWAAYLAIDDGYQSCLERDDPAETALTPQLARLVDAVEEFDRELLAHVDLLAGVTETDLLERWRLKLGPEFRRAPPWWLSGTLEAAAQRIHRQASADERSFREQLRSARKRRPGWWLPPLPQEAAAGDEQRPPALPPLRWHSPDGNLVARLTRPARPRRDEESLTLGFRQADGRPADLADQPVYLASVAGHVGSDGKARFLLGALRAAGQEPRLEVGPERIAWVLEERPCASGEETEP
jgi:hypothetical protein